MVREFQRSAVQTRANSMAFSFFLALFPGIILLLTLVPLVSKLLIFWKPLTQQNLMNVLLEEIDKVLPGTAGTMVTDAFTQLDEIHETLISVGLFLAIFFASNGMVDMMRSFEKRYKSTFKQRKFLRKRLVAIGLVFQMGFLVILSVLLLIVGDFFIALLVSKFDLSQFSNFLLQTFRWVVILLLFYSGFAILYRFGPSTYQRFKWLSPGATLATLLSLVVSVGFSSYVDNFGTYNRVYGSIGTIIVLMLWMQLNCYILLIGFELNTSIAVQRDVNAHVVKRKKTIAKLKPNSPPPKPGPIPPPTRIPRPPRLPSKKPPRK